MGHATDKSYGRLIYRLISMACQVLQVTGKCEGYVCRMNNSISMLDVVWGLNVLIFPWKE